MLGRTRRTLLVLLVFGCDDALPPTAGDGGGEELTLGPDASPDAGFEDSGEDDAGPVGPKKRVFVTLGRFNGNLGGILGGDQRCQAEADAAQVGGEWKAWISTPAQNALQRMADVGPWVLMDGRTEVFSSRGSIIDGPKTPIRTTARGNPTNTQVWTGTLPDGTVSSHTCQSWTSGFPADFAELGSNDRQDVGWTSTSTGTCTAGLYCFEQ